MGIQFDRRLYKIKRDSQDEEDTNNNSQDLFREDQTTCSDHGQCNCKQNTLLLKEILKELNELKNSTAREQPVRATGFNIDRSPMERPLMDYLKGRFGSCPFLADPDTELKNKILSLKRRLLPESDAPDVLRQALRFSARKMVDFRAQTKNKILSRSNKSEDMGCKSIEELCRTLYGKFVQEQTDDNVNLTVVLRSFCHEKRMLKKQGGEHLEDFWGSFRNYLQDILDDSSEDKWRRLREREEKRIERYNK